MSLLRPASRPDSDYIFHDHFNETREDIREASDERLQWWVNAVANAADWESRDVLEEVIADREAYDSGIGKWRRWRKTHEFLVDGRVVVSIATIFTTTSPSSFWRVWIHKEIEGREALTGGKIFAKLEDAKQHAETCAELLVEQSST